MELNYVKVVLSSKPLSRQNMSILWRKKQHEHFQGSSHSGAETEPERDILKQILAETLHLSKSLNHMTEFSLKFTF